MAYSYSTLPGFFPDYMPDATPEQALTPVCGDWPALRALFADAQANCPPNVAIKLLLVARHCQGEHNAMDELHIPKNHGFTLTEHRKEMGRIGRHHPLFDPGLSPKGQDQAKALAEAVKDQTMKGMPVPMQFVSPAKRAVETWQATWGTPPAGAVGHSGPMVLEGLREKLHVHLCNARRPLSVLKADHARLICPPQMAELDPWWQPGEDCRYERSDTQPPAEQMQRELRGRETEEEMYSRAQTALGEIMRHSEGQAYVSITSHSYFLKELFKVLGSPSRELREGEICPLVVRVETKA
ncbi:histidine phosphatase superfamily [Dioszegia hungarica]|uniref:Histidine phosphatase superfamily n=1 Tax=Dioszegia hungarica TaxID=4972 RepID=A0AA38HCJ3_9TREE|nr:histidine phosphatase superfamily [Dioszegia hungarica]KAI9639053.1 histidine phosphatase superfamily [Dioszegia hungarica]